MPLCASAKCLTQYTVAFVSCRAFELHVFLWLIAVICVHFVQYSDD